jgi:hypothetical protein
MTGVVEVLVILSVDHGAALFERVSTQCHVRQMASRRVVVLECSPDEIAKLRSVSGVTVIADAALPAGVLEGMDEGEVLFMTAWAARAGNKTAKKRLGEGLSWDAPGFDPPDPPTGKGATEIKH